MPSALAPSVIPSEPPADIALSEVDFEAIHAALLASERGRWFLAEYARRNRHADTAQVLAAIDRLVAAAQADVELRALADAMPAETGSAPPEPVQGTVQEALQEPVKDSVQEPPFDVERLRAELADMANAITRAKSEIAAMKAVGSHADGRSSDAAVELDGPIGERAIANLLGVAEQVQELAWGMREQGADERLCDRLERCASDIYGACSLQDLTGQRSRRLLHVVRYLEIRVRAASDLLGAVSVDPIVARDVVQPVPHAHDTQVASQPEAAVEVRADANAGGGMVSPAQSESVEPSLTTSPPTPSASPEIEASAAGLRAFASTMMAELREATAEEAAGLVVEMRDETVSESPASMSPAELSAPDSSLTVAAVETFSPPAEEVRTSGEATHDAAAIAPLAPAAEALPVGPPTESPLVVPPAETIAAADPSVVPEVSAASAEPPKREDVPAPQSDLVMNLFADVMALSEEERIALFT
jgi:chemotaxis protein CheZ